MFINPVKTKIDRNIADSYIERYYKKKYSNIDLNVQPKFWEAVGFMCEVGIDQADISNLIDTNENYIFRDGYSRRHVSHLFKDIKNVEDLVNFFAREILESESYEYTRLDIFILQKEIERINRKIDYLDIRKECF